MKRGLAVDREQLAVAVELRLSRSRLAIVAVDASTGKLLLLVMTVPSFEIAV